MHIHISPGTGANHFGTNSNSGTFQCRSAFPWKLVHYRDPKSHLPEQKMWFRNCGWIERVLPWARQSQLGSRQCAAEGHWEKTTFQARQSRTWSTSWMMSTEASSILPLLTSQYYSSGKLSIMYIPQTDNSGRFVFPKKDIGQADLPGLSYCPCALLVAVFSWVNFHIFCIWCIPWVFCYLDLEIFAVNTLYACISILFNYSGIL